MTTNLKHVPISDFSNVEELFLNINRQRIELTRKALNERQASFIELLPLLFHENNPDLPGYISDEVPNGIYEYSPEPSVIKIAKGFFSAYKTDRRARRILNINGIYFMGSSGSIAYNNKSDFDVWILHSNSLDADAIDLIQQKAYAIEQWADETLKLEVHFFIFSAEEFKQGKQQGLSSESSGSAQHYLLLDEFYRSSLLIAGKIPTWWLVPPEQDKNYDEYINDQVKNNKINLNDSIDFGTVADIPASEFFGAAVWQLYKSIDSPYKSLIKLLLMEVYASEYPTISILSTMFKEAIYQGINKLDELDPYLMMYKKVETYLQSRNQRERLELFRQCFYIKMKEPLSHDIKKESWRRNLFKQVVLDWGWVQRKLVLIDSRKEWQIEMISQQRNQIMNALTESYHFLSSFARKNTEVSRVSQTELNVLGRKLYAAFERKAGKVDIFNRDSETSMSHLKLTIYQKKNISGNDNWLMYQGHIDTSTINDYKPVKRAQNILELIAWAFFNKIIDSHSAISLINRDALTVKELRQLLITFEDEFPKRKLVEADFNDLNQTAHIKHTSAFVNLGFAPKNDANNNIKHISSTRDNVLSYGAQHNNLISSVDLLVCTTWEELLTFRFTGPDAFLQFICEYFKWAPLNEPYRSPKLNIYSYTSSYDTAITKRIEEIIQDIIFKFYGKNAIENTRYFIEVEDTYYVLINEENRLCYKYIGSSAHLLQNLSKPNHKFSPVIFEKQTRGNTLIQQLFKVNNSDKIQLFFSTENNMAEIFIIDENGSLFFQSIPFHDSESLINHFNLFFQATINRRVFLMLDTQTNIENMEIEFFSIDYDKSNKINLNKIQSQTDRTTKKFFNIQVIGSTNDEHHSLTIFCGDVEFSFIEHGNELFNVVADYVVKQRENGQRYPIYITDIDISRGLIGKVESDELQTVHYLNYKKNIEDKLNLAIATH